MLVLRAFRDAGCVSAGSPPSHRQAERWSKRRCAFHPGFLLSFFLSGFPLGAGRKGSVVGGTQRAFSSRRTGAGSPGRAFALAAQKPGAGRGRWAGRRGAAGVSGGGLFPRRQRQFRSPGAKKQATKRRTKRDFPSPERRRFVKTGFSARYKEARRSGRPRGRKSPGPGKGDRRGRLSRFTVKKSGRHGRLSHFAVKKSERASRLSRFAAKKSGRRCRLSRFAAKKSGRRCRLSRFAVEKSGRHGRLCYFAVKKSGRPSRLLGGPKGGSNLWKPLAGDRRALSREFPTNSGPGVSGTKIQNDRPEGRHDGSEAVISQKTKQDKRKAQTRRESVLDAFIAAYSALSVPQEGKCCSDNPVRLR